MSVKYGMKYDIRYLEISFSREYDTKIKVLGLSIIFLFGYSEQVKECTGLLKLLINHGLEDRESVYSPYPKNNY